MSANSLVPCRLSYSMVVMCICVSNSMDGGMQWVMDAASHPNDSNACRAFRVEATGKEDKESATWAMRNAVVRWSGRKKCDCDGSR